MSKFQASIALFCIVALGLAVRLASLQWNWFMHADVIGDATVTASLRHDGTFTVYPRMAETVDPAEYDLLALGAGEPLKLHGPLVPVIGAGVMLIGNGESVADAYFALRLITLIAATLTILLSFLVARRLLDTEAGLAAAAWVAASFVLIDFAGNGALYTTQGAIYLLWALIALRPPSVTRTALLGLVGGLGYLVNFQCVLLLPAGIVVLFADRHSWKTWIGHAVLLVGITGLVALPWLIRSAVLFGDPLFGHAYNLGYPYGKAGILIPDPNYPYVGWRDKLGMLHAVVTLWTPNNLYYAARKLFILAPFAFFFFSYGLINVAFSPCRLRKALPVILLLVLQIFLYAAWPIWKFRFFVPLMPFVFILALEEMWHVPISRLWRRICVGITFAAILIISWLTYTTYPTHTTYYDGALTEDAHHASEELDYLERFHLLPATDAQ